MRFFAALLILTGTLISEAAPSSAALTLNPLSHSISTQLLTPAPVITGYSIGSCVSLGSTFIIYGHNFGKPTGKKVVLGGHGTNIPLNILSWGSTQIKVLLPMSPQLTPRQWYYTGIRQISPVKWLSNISKNLIICASTAKPVTQQVPALSSPALVHDTALLPNLLPRTSILIPPVKRPGSLQTPSLQPAPHAPGGLHLPPPAPFGSRTMPPSTGSTGDAPDSNSDADTYYGEDSAYYGDDMDSYTQDNSGQLIGNGPPSDFTPQNDEGSQGGAEPENIEPGEVIVASSSMEEAQAMAQQAESIGLRIKSRKSLHSLGMVISVFRTPEGMTATQALAQLHQSSPKVWMDVNHRFSLQGGGKTKSYPLDLIHWHTGIAKCTSDVRIGMVDTVVDIKHKALQGAIIQTHAFTRHGMITAPAEHGTAIAALMVGQAGSDFAGLAPQAQLYAAEVFRQRDDRHIDATAERILSGLDWLGSQHVQVVNLSFGGSRDMLIELALHQLMKQGISIVAAAGNAGLNGVAMYPAAQKGVIAVTAIDAKLHLYRQASQGAYVDFSAPGVDLWAASGKGRYVSGTSYATPFITIAIALAGANSQQSNSKQLLRFLKIHTTDLGESGKDSKFGWGIINFEHICDTKLHQ